jgi:hypothetical protein
LDGKGDQGISKKLISRFLIGKVTSRGKITRVSRIRHQNYPVPSKVKIPSAFSIFLNFSNKNRIFAIFNEPVTPNFSNMSTRSFFYTKDLSFLFQKIPKPLTDDNKTAKIQSSEFVTFLLGDPVLRKSDARLPCALDRDST